MKYTEDILKESDKDALDIMRETWELSRSHYDNQFQNMKRQLKLYHMKIYDYGVTQRNLGSAEPVRTDLPEIMYPAARAICDATLAAVRGTIMPDEIDWLEAEGLASELGKEEVEIARAFMNYRLRRMKFGQKMERLILQAMQCRWSVGMVHWKIQPGYIALRRPEMLELKRILRRGGFKGLLDKFLSWVNKGDIEAGYEYDPYKTNRSDFTVLPTLDTAPDWRGPTFDDSQFFMFERWIPWGVLESGEYSKANPDGKYYNISALKADRRDNRADSEPTEAEKFQDDLTHAAVQRNQLPDGLRTRFYLAPNGLVMCDHEHKAIICKRRMTGFPLVKLTYAKADNSFDTDSALQLLEPLQRQTNMIVNWRIENQDKGLRKILVVNRDLFEEDREEITLDPSQQVIEVYGDARAAVAGIEFPDVTAGWQDDIQFMLDAMTRLSGLDVNAQALYYEKHRPTATETTRVMEAMMTRLGRWEREIETEIVIPAISLLYDLEDRFYDEELMLLIHGTDATFYPVLNRRVFEIIGGNIIWIPKGSVYWQTKREEQASVERIFQLALSAMPLHQNMDFNELFREILVRNNIRDPERFFIDRQDREYTIDPEKEHMLMAAGHKFPPGNRDNHELHMQNHTAYRDQVQAGMVPPDEFPPQNLGYLIWHMGEHQKAMASMQTTNPLGLPVPGGMNLPMGQTMAPQGTPGTITANQENIQPRGVNV